MLVDKGHALAASAFRGPLLKLVRAGEQLEELNGEIAKYRASSPATYRAVGGAFEGKIDATPVPWFAAIAGDIVHNLRAALDQAACELVRIRGGNVKNVYFPFSDSETRLDEAIKSKNFDRAGADAVALLKTLRPYKGGNEVLRATMTWTSKTSIAS